MGKFREVLYSETTSSTVIPAANPNPTHIPLRAYINHSVVKLGQTASDFGKHPGGKRRFHYFNLLFLRRV